MSAHARGIGCGDQAFAGGEFERQRHAERHRLAMQQPLRKAGAGLQRVTEGMAEIEQRAFAGLALVARDDAGLAAAADRDGVLARRTAGEYVLPVGFQPGEERGVAEQSEFGDLGIAGAEFALRQRVEQRGVGDHQNRLMEGADQILAVAGIDAGLAADRRIDLRQQRRRHLHEVEAAPHAGRGIAGEIADHAAAERDHQIAALDARRDDRLAHGFEGRVVLGALAWRHDDGRTFNAGRLQRAPRPPPDDAWPRSASVTIATLAAGRSALMRSPSDRDQPAADDDVVGARRPARPAPRSVHRERSGAVMAVSSAATGMPRCLASAGDDFVDDGVVRLVARLHRDVGQRIDRLAQRQQVLDLVDQRPVAAPLGAFHQHVEIGLQPDRDALDRDEIAGAPDP